MKIKSKPSLKGYITLHRSIQTLLKDNIFDFTMFGAYIGFVLQADWDKKHPNYGCLLKTDSEIAGEWGVNPTTVWRKKNALVTKGFLNIRTDGLVHVTHINFFDHKFNQLVAPIPFSPMQEVSAKQQEEVAEEQDIHAKPQGGDG